MKPASSPLTTATMIVLFTGVMLFGLTLANIDGSRPSRPIANRMRVCPYIVTRVTEKIEITAPAASTVLDPGGPGDVVEDLRETGLGLAVESTPTLRAEGGEWPPGRRRR